MKVLKLLVIVLSFATAANAQILTRKVVTVQAPIWAQSKNVAANYYYLPEIDTYYDVPAQQFIYLNNSSIWVKSKRLPASQKAYNLKNGKIIYLTEYKGKKPYLHHKSHKAKYYGITQKHDKPKYVKVKSDNGKHLGQKKNGTYKAEKKHGKHHKNKKHDD